MAAMGAKPDGPVCEDWLSPHASSSPRGYADAVGSASAKKSAAGHSLALTHNAVLIAELQQSKGLNRSGVRRSSSGGGTGTAAVTGHGSRASGVRVGAPAGARRSGSMPTNSQPNNSVLAAAAKASLHT